MSRDLEGRNSFQNEAVLNLPKATLEDRDFLFYCRNLPQIVALGKTQNPVTWDEHCRWFDRALVDPNQLLFIAKLNDVSIGQIRFNLAQDHSCEVSIYLLSQYVGKGVGHQILELGCQAAFSQLNAESIVANVRYDNERALHVFQKLGFELKLSPHSEDETLKKLVLERPFIIPHNRLTHGELEAEAIKRTVQSGYWAAGPRVRELEVALATRAEVKHAVCVASGLAALRLALRGLNVGEGDEVVVPAYSCVALANAALACGAFPVACDVEEQTWNLPLEAAQTLAKTRDVRAVIAINLFGVPAQLPEKLKDEKRVPWIEDCAHAFGKRIGSQPLGSRADAAITSFYATKLMGAGEGGAVLTDSDDLATFVREWRDYTDKKPDGTRGNDKMNDLEATLALCQLQRLDEMLERRAQLAEKYFELLKPLEEEGLVRLPVRSGERIWYRFTVEVLQGSLNSVVQGCRNKGVQVELPVSDWRDEQAMNHPVANRAYGSLISLPLYPTLHQGELKSVVQTFVEVCRKNSI